MSAGKEVGLTSAYLTRTSSADNEQLCSLDALGLEDKADRNQQSVYEEFKEQLRQSAEGWYETGWQWKHGHEPLPNNKQGSLKKGVKDTKIRAGVGAHGLKSRGKSERRPPRPAHKISFMDGWIAQWPYIGLKAEEVSTRSKIREKDYITWRHVNTDQKPADVGSRGCDRAKLPNLWLKGPEWLASPESWPAEILTEPSKLRRKQWASNQHEGSKHPLI